MCNAGIKGAVSGCRVPWWAEMDLITPDWGCVFEITLVSVPQTSRISRTSGLDPSTGRDWTGNPGDSTELLFPRDLLQISLWARTG